MSAIGVAGCTFKALSTAINLSFSLLYNVMQSSVQCSAAEK